MNPDFICRWNRSIDDVLWTPMEHLGADTDIVDLGGGVKGLYVGIDPPASVPGIGSNNEIHDIRASHRQSWDLLRTHIFPRTRELPNPFLKQKKNVHICKKKICTYAKFLKKKSLFRKKKIATGLVFERFLAPEVGFSKKLTVWEFSDLAMEWVLTLIRSKPVLILWNNSRLYIAALPDFSPFAVLDRLSFVESQFRFQTAIMDATYLQTDAAINYNRLNGAGKRVGSVDPADKGMGVIIENPAGYGSGMDRHFIFLNGFGSRAIRSKPAPLPVGYPRDAPATVLFGEWFRFGKPSDQQFIFERTYLVQIISSDALTETLDPSYLVRDPPTANTRTNQCKKLELIKARNSRIKIGTLNSVDVSLKIRLLSRHREEGGVDVSLLSRSRSASATEKHEKVMGEGGSNENDYRRGNGGTNLGHLFRFIADQFSDAGALLSAQHMERIKYNTKRVCHSVTHFQPIICSIFF
ncbi:hypothetical protein LXL04_019325 [Taraxacum kok-saghyz]